MGQGMPCVMVQSMPCSGEEQILASDISVLTEPAVESFAEYKDPRIEESFHTLLNWSYATDLPETRSFATLPGGHLSFATILPEEHAASFHTEPPCNTSFFDRLDSVAPPDLERPSAVSAAAPPGRPEARKDRLAPAALYPPAAGHSRGASAKVQRADQPTLVADVPRPLLSRGGAAPHLRHGLGAGQPTASFPTHLEPTEEEWLALGARRALAPAPPPAPPQFEWWTGGGCAGRR